MNNLVTINNTSALENIEVTRALMESNDFADQYLALKAAIDYLTGVKKGLDSKISAVITPLYEADGTTTVCNDKLNFTYCAPTTSMAVDSAKLKKEFPDVYRRCVKTQQRNASLRVTEKNSGEDNA